MSNILWSQVGGVTDTTAKIAAKIGYSYGSEVNNPKVYTIWYDTTTYKVFCNGVLVQSVAQTGHTPFFGDIYLGSDYDNTCHFKGILPNLIFWNQGLNDTDRIAFENWMADKWVPNGTVLNGHTVGAAGTKPTITTSGAAAFMDFDETGLTISTGRVTKWTDSTTLGTQRVATPTTGTIGLKTIKGLNALYFDNETNLHIPILDTSPNSPNPVTIMFVAQFDDFDTNQYSGDTDQSIISAGDTGNAALRIKKFDTNAQLDVKFGATTGTIYVDIPKATVIDSTFIPADLGSVQLKLGTSTANRVSTGSPQTLNSGTFGIGMFNVTALTKDTNYYGIFEIDGAEDPNSAFTFKTIFRDQKSFKIIAGSCNVTGTTAATWDQILTENADTFVHLGDLNYENVDSTNQQDWAKTLDLTMNGKLTPFLRGTGWNYIFDNHDSLGVNPNNTFADWGIFIDWWNKSFPCHTLGSATPQTDGCYYYFDIGRTRCIILEMRSQRDPITDTDGPTKTQLGANQKQWLKDTLLAAKNDATIEQTLIFSPTLWLADKNNPYGNSFQSPGMSWANYAYEREEIANYIYDNTIPNITFVCGDTHMQCIDDGRNAVYSTLSGTQRTIGQVASNLVTPVLEASPFDQYTDVEGGPFNITDVPDSGGPYISYSQSYGIIEVMDLGENWLQIRLSTKALVNGAWVRTRVYSYNWNCNSGTVGTPPAIDNFPDQPSLNGYAGKNSVWDRIQKRFIGKNNSWVQQLYKFIGKNGYWVKSYDNQIIQDNNPISLYTLNGYTGTGSNNVEITGKGFLSSQYPQPQTGGYYELSKNYGDTFQNFSNGSVTGSPAFTTIANVLSLNIAAVSQYFTLPTGASGIDGQSLVVKDFFIGVWCYMAAFPTDKYWLWKYSDGTNTLGVYVDNAGKINIKTQSVTLTSTTAINLSSWNSVGLNIKQVDNTYSQLFINGVIDALSLATLVIVIPTAVSPISFGADSTTAYSAAPNFNIANVYITPRFVPQAIIDRYHYKPVSTVVLHNIGSDSDYDLPDEWVSLVRFDNKLSFTIPPGTATSDYLVYVKSLDFESIRLPLTVVGLDVRTTPLSIDFTQRVNLQDTFYALNHGWGGANGGVVANNVYQDDSALVIESHGDLYSGAVQGVDNIGNSKLHTDSSDPKNGQPWTNRVGGCLTTKQYLGFGRYEIVAKLPPILGVASAFWLFHYEEVYPGDPRYTTLQESPDNLSLSGDSVGGYYIVRNHEIDIEFPSNLGGDLVTQPPNLSTLAATTWRGQNTGEFQTNREALSIDAGDGQFHKYRFDWYNDKIEWYIDDVLITTIASNIPDIPGRFNIGCWFPSSPLADKSWLADPEKGWASGIVDTDGGLKANFDTQKMYVTSFKFTPFTTLTNRIIGETYAFGGLRVAGND